MFKRQRRYPAEELDRRGTELYETRIRALVEDGNIGRFCLIDVESGEFEVADELLAAAMVLIDKNPDVQLWCKRIGYVASSGHHCRPEREKR